MSTPQRNPWGLTSREEDLMDTVCQVGSLKAAARILHRSVKTLEAHGVHVGIRMGESHPVRKAVLWDRWRRDNPRASAQAGSDVGGGLPVVDHQAAGVPVPDDAGQGQHVDLPGEPGQRQRA